jgi:hypothetical protein
VGEVVGAKGELTRTELITRDRCPGDRRRHSYRRKMLWQQPRFAPLGANIHHTEGA